MVVNIASTSGRLLDPRRIISISVLIAFTATNHFIFPSGAEASTTPTKGARARTHLPSALSQIEISSDIGVIADTYQGTSPHTVILLQDAHAIPDAQRNIQKLIHHFQNQYGVNRVAVEGTSARLNPQIFRSFPDKALLQKTFERYFERGELTGTTAAAIFSEGSEKDTVFQGVEDWQLYEEGLGLYLQALNKEPEILKSLDSQKTKLRVQKERVYSETLLKVDRALEDFQSNHGHFNQVLELLATVKAPEKGTELTILVEEIKREDQGRASGDVEVRQLASKLKRLLAGDESRSFNQKYQEFQTSRLTPQAFALYLQQLASKQAVPFNVSTELKHLVRNQKKMRDLNGTRLFKAFERYAQGVKDSLFRNAQEKALDQETHRLNLIEKVTRLEISREQWHEIKGMALSKGPFGEALKAHFAFYDNTENRDHAFLSNLKELLGDQGPNAVLFVAGGFHTEGLTERFKENNLSYLLIRPQIDSIPHATAYRNQMRGDVSWKNYFEIENGKIDL